MDYNAIMAWAAIITAIVAIVSIIIERKRTRFSMSVDLLFKLNDEFNSPKLLRNRIRAAKSANTGRINGGQVDDILDFFETVGYLVRRGALDKDMVSSSFYYYLHYYYLLTQDYRSETRKKDCTIWEDFELIHNKLVLHEKRQHKCEDEDLIPSQEEIQEFITDEINLPIK